MVVTGTIGADTAEGPCVYIETSDGTRYELLLPADLASRDDVKPGSRLTLRGQLVADMASICQIGPILRVTEVRAAGD